MILLGIPIKRMQRRYSVTTISLTPCTVSTNLVVDYLIRDILGGTIGGSAGIDAEGTETKIFLDISGFLGDYPACSDVLYVVKHSAGAPYTHCIFRYLYRDERPH